MAELGSAQSLFYDPGCLAALPGLGFFAVDYAAGTALASSAWLSWGYQPSLMLERRFEGSVDPDNDPAILERLRALWDGGVDAYSATLGITRANGERAWAHVSYVVVSRMEDGTPRLVVGHEQDVSALKSAELESRLRLLELEAIRRVSNELSTSLDLEETVTSILEHTKTVIPYDKATVQLLLGDRLQVIGCVGFSDRAATLELSFKIPTPGSPSTIAIQSRQPVVCNDIEEGFPGFYQAPDENPIRSWLGIPLIANNEVLGLMALDSVSKDFYSPRHREIAAMMATHVAMAVEKACLYKNMQDMAKTDGLTGIGNRHSLRVDGSAMFEDAKRNGDAVTMLMADLDHFKDLNDAYGHGVGDIVLAEVSKIIASKLRSSDLLIRYGGEEFLAILEDSSSARGLDIAERIRCAVGDHLYEGIEGRVTISIGVHSAVPDKDESLSGFIKRADKALYLAKEAGRDRVISNCD